MNESDLKLHFDNVLEFENIAFQKIMINTTVLNFRFKNLKINKCDKQK